MFTQKFKRNYGHPDIKSLLVSSSVTTAFLENGDVISAKRDSKNIEFTKKGEKPVEREPQTEQEKQIAEIVKFRLMEAGTICRNGF